MLLTFIVLALSGLLTVATFSVILFSGRSRVVDRATLPIRARMAASQSGVSYRYARRALALQDKREHGDLDDMGYLRQGMRITEDHPDDWKKGKRHFTRR